MGRAWPQPGSQLRSQEGVLSLLEANGGAPMTAGSVAAVLGTTGRAVQILSRLVALGKAERVNDNGVFLYRVVPTTGEAKEVGHARAD